MDKPHKNLIAWQKSIELVKEIYDVSNSFPDSEKFGLISQIRRCSISIPSNIAEGSARGTLKDKKHFYIIARASLSELDTQLEIAKMLKYISKAKYNLIDTLMIRCDKLLYGLINKIK